MAARQPGNDKKQRYTTIVPPHCNILTAADECMDRARGQRCSLVVQTSETGPSTGTGTGPVLRLGGRPMNSHHLWLPGAWCLYLPNRRYYSLKQVMQIPPKYNTYCGTITTTYVIIYLWEIFTWRCNNSQLEHLAHIYIYACMIMS